ncbi:hypothetical protein [Streptomyces gibsoniae]|uniref:Uncharacterized protein n=1 Tax=Streptomyces gibsoniae TaxID=3075529 RepID=A0ABU2U6G0_9ACTN|nr:hypothetical protein [Streptomyces sp. DSM 41699]MDT0468809.1 hypothetical protein [Streptomyces sp. DSM 41699]
MPTSTPQARPTASPRTMFFVSTGDIDLYCGKYQAAVGPQE